MFVAELHNHYQDSAILVLPAPIPVLMILVGMFMAGYPQDSPQNAHWSHIMSKIMRSVTADKSDVRRYWDHIGAATILLGIFFSRNARRLLSSPIFNFLGRVSFPVYLMHNTFIKSVLTWMVYLPSAMNPPRDENGHLMDLKRGTTSHVFIAIVIFYYLLYRSAALWVQYIDPFCGKMVSAATSWAYGETPMKESKPILCSSSQVERSKLILPA